MTGIFSHLPSVKQTRPIMETDNQNTGHNIMDSDEPEGLVSAAAGSEGVEAAAPREVHVRIGGDSEPDISDSEQDKVLLLT